RYNGTRFSARISEVRSESVSSSAGMACAAVVVQAALIAPDRRAAKSVDSSGNWRGLGSLHTPIEAGWPAPLTAPGDSLAQLRTAAATSRPPQASAVASVTASEGLSSAD